MKIEKSTISENFSDAAKTYDSWAKPQKEIAKRLVGLLKIKHGVNNVLDLGCGTGNVIEQFISLDPDAKILGIDIAPGMIGVCIKQWSDFPHIKFCRDDISCFNASEKYDYILSSCAFQWVDCFSNVMKRLGCSLDEYGTIAIAVLIDGSFFELYNSYRSVFGCEFGGVQFKTKDYYVDTIQGNGLSVKAEMEEVVKGHFYDLDLLKYFKKIGATFKNSKNYKPLGIKEVHELLEYYKNQYGTKDGLLPVTHKVLYLTATTTMGSHL